MPVEDRRAQLVDAALAIAAAEGISAATVRRVAERAGVALGVVHYCFEDKDELFASLAERIIDELTRASSAGLRLDGRHDLRAALGASVAGLWALVEATPSEQLLTYELTTHALRNPELRAVALRQYEASHAAVEAVLRLAAEASGAVWARPLGELAAETLAFIDGVTLRWLVDRDGRAARARLASFVEFLAGNARARRARKKVAP